MIGLLGRGLRFGSKSGISAGRDLVKKRCIWSACCCEPSQCGAVVTTNFRAKLQLELFPATSVLAQWLSSFPSFRSFEGGVASFWRNSFQTWHHK
ncbi:hypothetical protein T10_10288 [Trichinella papuae]|uniref:Uncharacterized protein n=1 Tax=Trichinella papuae TaxID=268474 RepID=A0A0V1MJ01_9BILA|nr:hypothetical protein T10_10288 [Trichinella papuae]